jgi:hypothetical protein
VVSFQLPETGQFSLAVDRDEVDRLGYAEDEAADQPDSAGAAQRDREQDRADDVPGDEQRREPR